MKAYEIEIYPDGGDVVIAQAVGAFQAEAVGQQFIRLSTDQLDQVCQWLHESAAVARKQQGHAD